MSNITNQGSQDPTSYALYGWQRMKVVRGLTTVAVGSIKNGKLTIDKEQYEHVDNSFPPKTDAIYNLTTNMTFECEIEEITENNLTLLLDTTISGANTFYVGDGAAPTEFTLQIERELPFLDTNNVIVAYMYKAVITSDFEMPSADANGNISLPFSCKAKKDANHSDRLGFIAYKLAGSLVP